MKRATFITVCFILPYSLIVKAQEPKTLDPVNKVEISDGMLLEIERSDHFGILVKSSELDSTCIITETANGVLTIKKSSNLLCTGKATIKLYCPALREISITGNAEVSTFNVFKTDSLKITQRSGGKSFFDLDVKYLDVYLTEGSIMSGSGYATFQKVEVTVNAVYSAFELEGDTVEIESSLGSKGKICASEKLKALAKIGGYISYKCNPPMTEIEKKGNGVIEASQ